MYYKISTVIRNIFRKVDKNISLDASRNRCIRKKCFKESLILWIFIC